MLIYCVTHEGLKIMAAKKVTLFQISSLNAIHNIVIKSINIFYQIIHKESLGILCRCEKYNEKFKALL